MIQITLDSNAAAIVQRLQAWPAGMLQAVAKTLDLQNQLTVGVSSTRYLSHRSSTTLGVVTNRLRSSLAAAPARVVGQSVITAIGSNVKYAGIHEFGFQGTVTVRAHTRRNSRYAVATSTAAMDESGRISKGKAKKKAGPVSQVRAHTMKMNMPARSYIRTALRDRADDYSAAVSQAVIGSWRNGGPA